MSKPKVVLQGDEARQKLLKGAYFMADAVRATHGPYGLNAITGLKGKVRVTNDGVSVAQDIQLEDEIENLGVRTAKEAAIKTNELAGDGTTTAIIILQQTLKIGVALLKGGTTFKGRMSAVAFVKKIKEEVNEIIEKLTPTPIKTREQLVNVARVSVEDDQLAELIGGTQFDLGEDGTILPEKTNDTKDSIERIRGVRIDNGFGTSLVINNLEKQTLEIKNTKVILTNHTLNGVKALEPLQEVLQQLANMQVTDVAVIARGFDENAIKLCMENHKNGFRVYPINAPYVNQKEVMKDLSAVTGAKYIDSEERNLESIQLSDVGFAERIAAQRFFAIITGQENEHTNKLVAARVEELTNAAKGSQSSFEKKEILARLSQLTNGFAILNVGGDSEVERDYKYDKIEDAVQAVKHALKEGVVKGGGLAFKEIADQLPDSYLLKPALLAPYNQIMENAGEVIEIPDWVQDPVKVVKTALIMGTSVASQLATAAVAIEWQNEKPEK